LAARAKSDDAFPAEEVALLAGVGDVVVWVAAAEVGATAVGEGGGEAGAVAAQPTATAARRIQVNMSTPL